jgi:hypothetical protein
VATDEYHAKGQPPGLDPALRRLDRFVGTWDVRGRTLDAEEDNVSGRLTFGRCRAGSSSSSASS